MKFAFEKIRIKYLKLCTYVGIKDVSMFKEEYPNELLHTTATELEKAVNILSSN